MAKRVPRAHQLFCRMDVSSVVCASARGVGPDQCGDADTETTPCLRQPGFLSGGDGAVLSRIMHIVTLAVRVFVDLLYIEVIQDLVISLINLADFFGFLRKVGTRQKLKIYKQFCVFLCSLCNFAFLPHATRFKSVSYGFWRVIFRLEANECFPSCEFSVVFLTELIRRLRAGANAVSLTLSEPKFEVTAKYCRHRSHSFEHVDTLEGLLGVAMRRFSKSQTL